MTSSSSDLDTLLENKKSYYLEALLCIHQVEAIEESRRKTQTALQRLEQSPEGGLPDSLHETTTSNNMLHMSDDDMVDVPPTPRLTRTSLADDLTDQEDDENASLHQQSDEESISHSLQQDPVSPLSFLHDSNSSSISNSRLWEGDTIHRILLLSCSSTEVGVVTRREWGGHRCLDTPRVNRSKVDSF